MTHEELVELLQNYASASGLRMDRNSWLILCDVVELHKPMTQADGFVICESCSNSEFFAYKDCPTIQAIVKELA
jgi:hypothetical protein